MLGTSIEKGGSGDPSPFTALGCRRGIEAIAHHVFGKPDLKGLHVAVQGVGHVGAHLARELAQAGARLTICDVDPARRSAVAAELGAAVVDVEADPRGRLRHRLALRARRRAHRGAGAASSSAGRSPAPPTTSCARPPSARRCSRAASSTRPTTRINGGGLINVAEEFAGYDAANARRKTLAIYDTIAEIIERSKREKIQPEVITDRIAEELIAAGPHPA